MMILATFSPAAEEAPTAAAAGWLRCLKSNHSRRQIPMAVQDGKAPKWQLKSA